MHVEKAGKVAIMVKDQPGSYGRSPFGGNLVVAPHELAAG